MSKIFKFFIFFSFLLSLSACGGGGGGGGGGGAAGGGVGTSVVTNCSDIGTAHQDSEYRGFNSAYHSLGPLSAVCASSAYARGATGDGINIAVVDTGVDADHAELNANLASFTTGSDLVNSDNTPGDDHGHGSHVAGIIAAEHNDNATIHGVAYDATLYTFKAFNSSGSGSDATTGGAFALIEDIAAIDIVNNSWGTNADCSSASACRTVIGSTTYDNWEDMSQLATPKISVFAAGNDSESEPSAECQTMAYNSDINAVSVCVVAVSHSSLGTDGGLLASFSNKCGAVASYCIAAPGDRIYSLTHLGGYTFESGTSMAAPMVSGGLALLWKSFQV